MSAAKSEIRASLDADIVCLQETHKDLVSPNIPGIHLIIHHPSPVHGSAIYVRDKSVIQTSPDLSDGGLEILQVDTEHLKMTSVNKPPAIPFTWPHTCHNTSKASL